jgi:hypothetical protein
VSDARPQFPTTAPERAKAEWPDQVQEILQDPAASFWLKGAITSALQRNPADALQDAAILTSILRRRANDGAATSVGG